jgi:hypothetical protein
MGRFVIAGYRPKPGMAAALETVAMRHWEVLRREALVTDRPAHLMRASDGTVVEVFEWLSAHSIARAHNNAAVQALWAEFAAVCEHVPLAQIPGADVPFAEFDAVPPPAG